MFSGFPDLPLVSKPATIDLDHETNDAQGCVKTLILAPVRSVRLTYPALCHLLSLSTSATKRRAVFGRVYGLQMGEEVTLTDVQPNLRRDPAPEHETEAQQSARIAEEKRHADEVWKDMDEMYTSEELDIYQAGCFVVGNATYNPFSKTLLTQLMQLNDYGQPAVMLYYDPFRTSLFGRPFLRAYVPTAEYVQYHELDSKKSKMDKPTKAVKDSKVTMHGALREVPVVLEMDAYHKLGLASVELEPVAPAFHAIHTDAMNDYVTALVHSVSTNADALTNTLAMEAKNNLREGNQNAPLAQKIDTLLALHHLREQTEHLEAVCDGMMLNASVLRDL